MLTVRARVPQRADYEPVLPIVIPDMEEVRALARHIHASGKSWSGQVYGWQAEYTPESRKKPTGSKMRFTPADFWIGESGIWFYSLMWENGKNKEPAEFLDDRGIVGPGRKVGILGRHPKYAKKPQLRPRITQMTRIFGGSRQTIPITRRVTINRVLFSRQVHESV